MLFCDCWLGVSAVSMGRRLLSNVHRASPMLFETGFWDLMICVWAIWAIIAIIAISMARSKNTGKGKASSSSMEQAVKKRKPDASQPVKKKKGKQVASSSESEELTDSVDEEIEAMFTEDSEGEHEKWTGQWQIGVSNARGALIWRRSYILIPSWELSRNRICTSCTLRIADIYLQ